MGQYSISEDRYSKFDPEVVDLCKAMNAMPGIRTVESCCGHGERPYRVWFHAEDLESLPRLLYYFDGCHCGSYDWIIDVRTDCGMNPATFCVIGPVGEKSYVESLHIASLLRAEVEPKTEG